MQKTRLINSLKQRGFSRKITNAFSKVPREKFIFEKLRERAYEDVALPIGQGQTISQPFTIATMLSLLDVKKRQKVLEIGSGCGYVLALLSELVGKEGKIFGIEVIKELANKSRSNLRNYKNIRIYNKNGVEGLEEHAPFDRILISAALERIPERIIKQLKEKGILVAPVGSKHLQSLIALQKSKNRLILKEEIPGFVFVPFIE